MPGTEEQTSFIGKNVLFVPVQGTYLFNETGSSGKGRDGYIGAGGRQFAYDVVTLGVVHEDGDFGIELLERNDDVGRDVAADDGGACQMYFPFRFLLMKKCVPSVDDVQYSYGIIVNFFSFGGRKIPLLVRLNSATPSSVSMLLTDADSAG